MAGGLGTLHEILDVHINQLLSKESRPIIIVGPMADMYQRICNTVKAEGLYWDKLPENIHYAKDATEALKILDEIIANYDSTGYINKNFYPVISSEEIYQNIKQYEEKYSVLYAGTELVVHPDVYPPNRFRSSLAFAKHIDRALCENKVVFDIGCGPGNLGILGARNGASKVVSVDINHSAVENAKENVSRLGLSSIVDVRQGSVFDAIGQERADVIFFHPPFHHEKISPNHTRLMNCVSTDGFKPHGKIYLGFSNKDPESLAHLEEQFKNFEVKMVTHLYQDTVADYRLYQLTIKQS
jgi:16S rRNA G1207 methylase RsmC